MTTLAVSMQHMPVCQSGPEQFATESFHYLGIKADGVFDLHVRISGSHSVTRTVCSKWAES